MEIAGKVAIVTGASAGIGQATARLFAQHGARVALVARSVAKLQQLAAELPGAVAFPADMRDETAIRQMAQQVHQHFGQIDILINNAGQGMYVPIEHADLQHYRAIFELNVVGVLCAMQAVIPLMRAAGGGVIINISSGTTKLDLANMALPNVGLYASTKFALNALSMTARRELASDTIRVGLVFPGITATDFTKNATTVQMTIPRAGTMPVETPEQVAEKILLAVNSEAPEIYADTIKPPTAH